MARLDLLSEKEIAILELQAACTSKRAMAAKLDISVRTVEHHRTKLMRKLRISSTTGLVHFAISAAHSGLLREPNGQSPNHDGNGSGTHADRFTMANALHLERKSEALARRKGIPMKHREAESKIIARGRAPAFWAATALLTVIVVATYWSAITGLVGRWIDDPDYVHGFLVPVFAAVLLWSRRAMLLEVELKGSLWGLVLIAFAGAMRMVSSYYYYTLLDPASLIPCLLGLTLFVGGWNAVRWAWPGIVFLVFMIPLPGFVANLMGHPLQRVATIASTFLIQTLGISAVAEGNVISLADSQIGVAEACNGLRNMMLFLAVCVGMAFISRRSAVEKAIIVLSAAAIALLANVVRIAATAILHSMVSHHAATTLYHDLAGWFMMPLAVVFLWLELAYLNRVFVRQRTSDAQIT